MAMPNQNHETMKASEFKAKCLALMDEVARTGERIVITKNGEPVAELVPHKKKRSPLGILERSGRDHWRHHVANRCRMGRYEVILIDTHVAIWATTDPEQIGPRSRALIEEAASEERILVSSISFWEIAFSSRRGVCGSANRHPRYDWSCLRPGSPSSRSPARSQSWRLSSRTCTAIQRIALSLQPQSFMAPP